MLNSQTWGALFHGSCHLGLTSNLDGSDALLQTRSPRIGDICDEQKMAVPMQFLSFPFSEGSIGRFHAPGSVSMFWQSAPAAVQENWFDTVESLRSQSNMSWFAFAVIRIHMHSPDFYKLKSQDNHRQGSTRSWNTSEIRS